MLYVNPLENNPLLRSPSADTGELRQKTALKEFERVFLYQFLQEMRKTAPKEGIFQGSQQQDFFEEMMDDYLAGQMAESGQLGIASQIQAQLDAVKSSKTASGDAAATHGLPLHRGLEGYAMQKAGGMGLAPSNTSNTAKGLALK